MQQPFQSPTFSAKTNHTQARSQSLSQTNFTFVTSEGDRVSLSSRSEVNTSLDVYSFQGLKAGQSVNFQGQQFSSSIQKNFQLLVEGDLNEQEQADIQEFLQTAGTLLQDLLQGNTVEASQAADSLTELDTLALASLFVRQSTSVNVASQSSNANIGDQARPFTGLTESLANPKRGTTLEQVLERLRETREKLQLDPERLLHRLPILATTLIESLRKNTESSDLEPPTSLLEQIRKEFSDSLSQLTSSSQSSHEELQPESIRQTDPILSPSPGLTENPTELSPLQ